LTLRVFSLFEEGLTKINENIFFYLNNAENYKY